MTTNGTKRYAKAKALVVEGAAKGLVLVRYYNSQPSGSRSLKVVLTFRGWDGIPTRGSKALARRLAKLSDRVNRDTTLGDTFYFV